MNQSYQPGIQLLTRLLQSQVTFRLVVVITGLWCIMDFLFFPSIGNLVWCFVKWIIYIVLWPVAAQIIIGIYSWVFEGGGESQ